MIPYWILFGVFALAALVTGRQTQHRYTPAVLAAALFLTIMIGLRYEVGGDWFAYLALLKHVRLLDLASALRASDPGYAFITWVAAQNGLGLWAVDLVCAAIFTWGLLELCRDQPNTWLALVIAVPYLVIVVAMGYTRQAAALGLLMAALPQYFRGRLWRVALALVIAAAFHKSAIIVIPLLVIASSRRRFLTILSLGAVALMIYYLFVVSAVDRLFAGYVAARYNASGAGIRIAMNLVPASIFLIWSRRFRMEREERRLWTVLSLGSFVAFAMFLVVPSSTAVDRISLYLIPLQVVVLSRLAYAFSATEAPSIALKFGVIGYSLLVQFVWLNFADNVRAWLPYRNYLTESRTQD
jgi:hypothetical protein